MGLVLLDTDYLDILLCCLGLVAILLLAGPETSLPDLMAVIFIQIAPIFYAFEGNYVAK